MSSEWVRVKVEDACELIVDCVNKTAPTVDYRTPYRMIRTSHIKNGKICLTDEKFVNKETYEKWIRRAKLQVGDVLLTREAPLGSVGMIREEDTLFLGQRIVQYRANKEVLVPGFLLYSFLAPDLQAQFHSYGGTGSTVDHIRVPDCVRFEISLPPLREQKAIAHILGTLDDKIELNRKTNETLEAMAKALFKSWFVDFDPVRAKAEGRPTGLPAEISDLFPDSFEDSELGEIPSGWEMEALGEILDVDKGVSYKGDFLSDTEGLPMVNLGCFAGGGSFRAEKMKFYAGEYREKHLASAGDLLVANTDMTQNRIILGAPIIVPSWRGRDKFLFSHHTFAIRFRHSKSAFTRFIYFTLLKPSFRQVAAGHATGTTVLALPKDGITDYQTVIPPAGLLNVFAAKVEALYQKCQALTEECELLAKTRDALLPKLISGEIRIPDAEKMLEEVGI